MFSLRFYRLEHYLCAPRKGNHHTFPRDLFSDNLTVMYSLHFGPTVTLAPRTTFNSMYTTSFFWPAPPKCASTWGPGRAALAQPACGSQHRTRIHTGHIPLVSTTFTATIYHGAALCALASGLSRATTPHGERRGVSGWVAWVETARWCCFMDVRGSLANKMVSCG